MPWVENTYFFYEDNFEIVCRNEGGAEVKHGIVFSGIKDGMAINESHYLLTYFIEEQNPILEFLKKGRGAGFFGSSPIKDLDLNTLKKLIGLVQDEIERKNNSKGGLFVGKEYFLELIYELAQVRAKGKIETTKKVWNIRIENFGVRSSLLNELKERLSHLADVMFHQQLFDTSSYERLKSYLLGNVGINWPQKGLPSDPPDIPLMDKIEKIPDIWLRESDDEDIEAKLCFLLEENFCFRWEADFLKTQIKRLDKDEEIISQNSHPEAVSKTVSFAKPKQPSFPEFLIHEKSDELAEKLKEEFYGEKKGLRFMIEALRKHGYWNGDIHQHGAKRSILVALENFFGYSINRQNLFQEPREWEYENLDNLETKDSLKFREVEEKVNSILMKLKSS